MSKINIIIQREYLRRVSKKSFLLITFLTPFLMVALVAVPLWLSGIKADDIKQVAIIDTTDKYYPLFEDTQHYHFIKANKSLADYRDNPDKELFAILNITDDLLDNPGAATLYSEKQIPIDLSQLINHTLLEQIEFDKLATYDIPNLKEIIEETKIRFNIQTIKWGPDGKENVSSSAIASVIGIVITTLIYLFIFLYGTMVMQGVTEEKTNRIIEIIISSVRPFDLMMGKIVGILLVGLTQVFLWGVMLFTFFTVAQSLLFNNISPEMMDSSMMMDSNVQAMVAEQPAGQFFLAMTSVNWLEIGTTFILFFIGGYFLYGSLFASIGAAIDNQEDSQQFMLPITFLLIFAVYAGIYSSQNPDGPLAFWCSMIPVTSPIVMMIRIPFDVPVWQTILSLVILYGSAIGIVWFAGKIYRVGILMYGKKPSVKEIIKWVRYK